MSERLTDADREAMDSLAAELSEKTDGDTRYFQWALIFMESDWLAAYVAARVAEALAPIEALAEEPCENYDTPGQDCITAGPEVFAAEACCRCRVRAALPAPEPAP